MRPMLTLTLKDLLLLWRNKAALFWVIAFPLAFGLFYGAIISRSFGAPKMSVAFIDEDKSAVSNALAEKLSAHANVRLVQTQAEGQPHDRDSATQNVRHGDLTAYLLLHPGFGESLRPFGQDGTKIELGIDPSRQAAAGFLQGIMMEATLSILEQQFTNPEEMRRWLKIGQKEVEQARDLPEAQKKILLEFFAMLDGFVPKLLAAKIPSEGGPFGALKLNVVPVTSDRSKPRSAFEITFPCSILWAVLGCMMTFTMSIVTEQTQGTLLRLRVAPLSTMHILGGKGLACFLSCIGTACILLLVGVTCLGVRVSSWPYVLASIAATAVCFSGLMMLLSVLGRTERAVGGCALAIILVMATLGGALVPLIAMPDWMLTMSHACPAKWGVLALEGAIWRGFDLAEMLLPWGILLLVGVLSFGLGARILSRRTF
jgi:ABC-2 type transport system permease protein